MLPGFFLESVGGGIRDMQKEAAARTEREQAQEFQMLQILAQHGTPEIQGVAGTALLDLMQNPNRPRAKGLGGFLGQTQKSPYFKDVNTALQAAQVAPAPQPPSAAMSTNAPVSPGSAPIQAPPPPPAPLSPDAQAVQTQTGARRQELGLPMAPEAPATGLAGPQGPPAPIQAQPMFPPPPPPPPHVRLFPTATELSQQKVDEQRMLGEAKDAETARAILQYGGTQGDVRDAIMASRGFPRRRVNAVPMILTVGGREVLGVFDPDTQTYEVDGMPVQPTNARRPPTSVPAGPRPTLRPTEGGELEWFFPPAPPAPDATGTPSPSASAAPVVVGTGKKARPPQPPPDFAGTSQVEGPDGPVVVQNPRSVGGPTRVVGPAKKTGTASDPQRVRYAVWQKEIDKRVKAITGKDMMTGQMTLPTPQQIQDIVTEVTKTPGVTYDDIAMGAAGGQVPTRGARSGKTPEQMGQLGAVLNRMSQQYAGNASPAAPAAPAPPPSRP